VPTFIFYSTVKGDNDDDDDDDDVDDDLKGAKGEKGDAGRGGSVADIAGMDTSGFPAGFVEGPQGAPGRKVSSSSSSFISLKQIN